jgi:heme A synthase
MKNGIFLPYAAPVDRQNDAAGELLAIGFGATFAMWACGYFARLFGAAVPPVLLFLAFVACLLAAGYVAGRYGTQGARGGAYAGLIVGLLNLLIVGSLISGPGTPNEIRRGAVLWVPGTIAVSVLLAALGAATGRRFRTENAPAQDWSGRFAIVAAAATFLLLAAGGVVTGADQGLAVVDWPNTEGYNMFLYPLSKMTGGVYLEHSHRLLGSLVGITTLVLAIHVHKTERRRWVVMLIWCVLVGVVIQGILGGLRVTGHLTLSREIAGTSPKIALAIVHGVFGQLVFGGLVALAVVRSRAWHTAPAPALSRTAGTDRVFGVALVALLVVQLVLGALVRHFTWALTQFRGRYGLDLPPETLAAYGTWALHLHITIAVLVVLLAVGVGVRAWGFYEALPRLQRLGTTLLALIGIQLGLGVVALILTWTSQQYREAKPIDVAITTAHQTVGAALLGWAVMLLVWNYRLLRPEATSPSPQPTRAVEIARKG